MEDCTDPDGQPELACRPQSVDPSLKYMVVINRRDEILLLNGSELSAFCRKQMACPKGWWEELLGKRSVRCAVSRLRASNGQWNTPREQTERRKELLPFLGLTVQGQKAVQVRIWWAPSCWQARTCRKKPGRNIALQSLFLFCFFFFLTDHTLWCRARGRRNYL